jgi:hypothetical protein
MVRKAVAASDETARAGADLTARDRACNTGIGRDRLLRQARLRLRVRLQQLRDHRRWMAARVQMLPKAVLSSRKGLERRIY